MKIHILGRNALNCALYLKFNDKIRSSRFKQDGNLVL